MTSPDNNNSKRTIHLKQSNALKQSGLVTDSVYYTDTNDIRISLNHNACADIIFTIDRKKWQNNLYTVAEMAEENGICDKESKLLKNHLNDNYDEILTLSTTTSNDDKNQEEEETTGQKSNTMASTAELLLDLFQEQEPAAVLFKDQFLVPHVLINIYDYYAILPIEDTKFRRYLSKLYYDNLKEVPNAEAVRNVVQLLAAKAKS